MASRFGGVPIQQGGSRFGGVPIEQNSPTAGQRAGQILDAGLPEVKQSGALTFDDVPDVKPSLMTRIKGDIQNRYAQGQQIADQYVNGQISAPSAYGQIIGKTMFGSGADALGEVAKTVWGDDPDEPIQKAITGAAQTVVGSAPVQYGLSKWQEFKANHPEAAGNLEAAGDVVNFLGSVGGVKGAVTAATDAAPVVKSAVNKVEAASQKLPGMLGDTKSGVSVSDAMLGVPEYTGNRVKGLFAERGAKLENTSAKLHAEAQPIYQEVDRAGGRINPAGIQQIKKNIDSNLGARDEIMDGKTLNMLSKMEKAMDSGDISVTKLDRYRRKFSAIADDTRKSVVDGGGLTEEGRNAVLVIKGIDESLKKLQPQHFSVGSPELVAKLEQARAASSRAFAFDRLKRIAQKAEGDPTRIKVALTKLVNDKSKMAGFTKEEAALLTEASKRSSMEAIERGLGTFGIDLGVRKNVAFPSLSASAAAGVSGAVPAAVAGVAAGTAARQASKYAARGKLQSAMDAVKNRPVVAREVPKAPAPEAPKLLTYQPEPVVMQTNSMGQTVPMTPTNRQVLGQSPGTRFENARIDKVMQLASPEAKATFASVWDKLTDAQKAAVDRQTSMMWAENETPLADMIKQSLAAVNDVVKATGQDVVNPAIREALVGAVKPPTMKEIMKMKPKDAQKVLNAQMAVRKKTKTQ